MAVKQALFHITADVSIVASVRTLTAAAATLGYRVAEAEALLAHATGRRDVKQVAGRTYRYNSIDTRDTRPNWTTTSNLLSTILGFSETVAHISKRETGSIWPISSSTSRTDHLRLQLATCDLYEINRLSPETPMHAS